MVRGTIPRQPAKTGRHEGVAKTKAAQRPAAKQPKKSTNLFAAAEPGTKSTSAPQKSASKKTAKTANKLPAGYNPTAPERVSDILNRLAATYPAATCALHHSNAWELLVATILSAQCTDARVNMVTPELFRKYPGPQAFARLMPEELEPDIKTTGFFRNKAKSIVGAARQVVEEFGGKVPDEMAPLLTLPGVARKTANVVLGTWFGKAEGVVVDTHVQRISRRLELTHNEEPQKIEQDLMQVLPRDKWIIAAHQIILHGRALCIARKPKCADCPLENICHAADKTWSTVDIHPSAKP